MEEKTENLLAYWALGLGSVTIGLAVIGVTILLVGM